MEFTLKWICSGSPVTIEFKYRRCVLLVEKGIGTTRRERGERKNGNKAALGAENVTGEKRLMASTMQGGYV
jgi:hypothetical protein